METLPNLRHVRLLAHAFSLNSLSRAAEAVAISQPAASQGIARLETQFGGQLFERRPGGLFITERGRVVAARAMRLIAILEKAGGLLQPKDGEAGQALRRRMETHVTTVHLRALAAFGQSGNLAAAAGALGQSETSLQRTLRDLESVCAVALLEGGAGSSRLTPLGDRLAMQAGRALKELESAFEDVGVLDGRFVGHVVIGTLPLARTRILPRAVASWSARWPGASLEIVDGAYEVLLQRLGMAGIDMLVGALRARPPQGFVQEELFQDGLAVIARAGHPLVSGGTPSAADLRDQSWILPREGTPTRGIFDCVAAGWGLTGWRQGLVETGSLVTIRGLLMETDRLTILSRRQIEHEEKAGLLAALPIPLPGTERPIGLTTRRGWQPTRLQADLLEALRDAAR